MLDDTAAPRKTRPAAKPVASRSRLERAPDRGAESRALLSLAEAIGRSPEALAGHLTAAAQALTGAASAGLALRKRADGLDCSHASGTQGARSEQCRSACERAMESGKAQFLEPSPEAAEPLLAVPFASSGQFAGALWVRGDPSSRPFDREDARLLRALCRMAGSFRQALSRSGPPAALREAEERQRFALEAAGMFAWDWDLDEDVIRRSAGVDRLIGRGRELGCGEEFLALVHPQDRDAVAQALRAALDGSGVYFAEFRLNRPEGEDAVWVADQGRVEFGPDGRVAWLRGVVRDITLRKRAQEAVVRQASELQAIMDSVPAVVFLAHDPECRRITGSRRAYEILRLPFGANRSLTAPLEERPRHFKVFRNGRQLHPDELPLQRASRGVEVRAYEELVLFEDGGSVRLFGNATPIRDVAGALRGAVATFVDITDRVRAEEALIEAKEAAEEANRAKSRFLAAASHDLRQPLQALHLYMGLLGERLAGREEELHKSIQRCLRGLSRLLDDLLDISKLDAGLIEATLQPVALDELTDWVANDFRLQAAEKGLRLDVVRCPLATGLSDPTLLGRILSNIVGNAVRYTDKGRILIGCRRRADRYRIEVWDTGIGIPPDKIPEIFREFHQLDNEGRNSERGTGLGLAIVDRLARLLRHRVEVRSWPGHGSMFAIDIPQTAGPAVEPAPTRKDAAPGRRGCVAVLEDETMVREALQIVLEAWGYQVVAAATPAALQRALLDRRCAPEIVIADYRLGSGLTGTEAIAQLRSSLCAEMPAIVLTGDTSP